MLKTTLPKDAIKADGYVSLEAPAVLAGHSCPTNIYTGGDQEVGLREEKTSEDYVRIYLNVDIFVF